MKAVYRQQSAKAGLPNWRRRVEDEDGSANACLNLANSLLYGVAAGVCSALLVSPSLGIIHQGAANAFLFDLADCFKTTVSIPAAFQSCRTRAPALETRQAVRAAIKKQRVLGSMVGIVTEMLEPHLPGTGEADVLYGGDDGFAPGHRNYASRSDDPEIQKLVESGEEPF